jgi:hypothetical protein
MNLVGFSLDLVVDLVIEFYLEDIGVGVSISVNIINELSSDVLSSKMHP